MANTTYNTLSITSHFFKLPPQKFINCLIIHHKASSQADRQASKQTDKQADRQASKETDRQTNRQAGSSQASRQTSKQTSTQAIRHLTEGKHGNELSLATQIPDAECDLRIAKIDTLFHEIHPY